MLNDNNKSSGSGGQTSHINGDYDLFTTWHNITGMLLTNYNF